MDAPTDTSKAGWLTQHKKAKQGMRRFFASRGFQVQYYETEAQARAGQNRKGCFDLGSCIEMRSSTLAGAPSNSVDLVLSQKRSGQPTLTVTVSFDSDGDRTAWLVLWCSAHAQPSLGGCRCRCRRRSVLHASAACAGRVQQVLTSVRCSAGRGRPHRSWVGLRFGPSCLPVDQGIAI